MPDDIRGFEFPFRIDPQTGGVATATGPSKIRQNIPVILSIRINERPMLRQLGTRIPSLVHDPNDDVRSDLVQTQAREAIMQWEPRVLVTDSKVSRSEGEPTLRLGYVILSGQSADAVVVPLS